MMVTCVVTRQLRQQQKESTILDGNKKKCSLISSKRAFVEAKQGFQSKHVNPTFLDEEMRLAEAGGGPGQPGFFFN